MKYFFYDSVTTTNDFAKELASKEGTVVVSANYQTRGKGRNSHTWEGDYGKNIYCSVGLNQLCMLTPEVLASYQLMGALIVYDTLKKIAPRVQFAIKYPNDVYAYDRKETKWKKISGVLVEHEFMGSVCMVTVIGMGVNIEQDTFSDDVENPISLSMLGVSITVDNFFSELKKFIEAYVDLPHNSIFQRYKKIVNIEGVEVEIKDKTGLWFVESLMLDSRLKVKNTETNEILYISDGDSIRYKLSAEQK